MFALVGSAGCVWADLQWGGLALGSEGYNRVSVCRSASTLQIRAY